MRWIAVVFLAVLILAALTELVAATPHDDAKDAPAGSTGGKIPTLIYILLMCATVGLTLYTFKDLGNRIYGNIVSSGLASICSFVLALFSGSGLIGEYTNLVSEKAYNSTTGVTAYTYAAPLMIQDLAMMFLWAFVGVTMFLFTAYLIVEAREEAKKQSLYIGGKP